MKEWYDIMAVIREYNRKVRRRENTDILHIIATQRTLYEVILDNIGDGIHKDELKAKMKINESQVKKFIFIGRKNKDIIYVKGFIRRREENER